MSLLQTLKDWQSLAGAIIGGLIAWFVAWYVARDARTREVRSAAMVAVGTLADIRAQYLGARESASRNEKSCDDLALAVGITLSSFRPTVPANLLSAIERLSLVHDHLAAHLTLVSKLLMNIEPALHRLEEDQRGARARGPGPSRERGEIVTDARAITSGMELIANHAGCAILLINRLVLSRFPTLHRLRRAIYPDDTECACSKALETGSFAKPIA